MLDTPTNLTGDGLLSPTEGDRCFGFTGDGERLRTGLLENSLARLFWREDGDLERDLLLGTGERERDLRLGAGDRE